MITLLLSSNFPPQAGADYLSTMVEVTFEPGVTSLPVPVTINDDSEIEADEIFTAVLTTSEQDVMIGEDIATVTIIDTDGKNLAAIF